MADHAHPQQFELVPVTAEDIIADRRRVWERFSTAATWTIGTVALVLILMAIFLL
jgi:hypothetical protein